jgi:hypothetical protein
MRDAFTCKRKAPTRLHTRNEPTRRPVKRLHGQLMARVRSYRKRARLAWEGSNEGGKSKR